jgi:membrane protease YdiL (CAAX protease family)
MRAIGAVIAFYASVTLGTVVVWLVLPAGWRAVQDGLAAQSAALLLSAVAAYLVMVWRRWATWDFLGWPGLHRALKGMLLGTGLGLAMAAAALLLAVGPGSARLVVAGWSGFAYARAAMPVAVLLLTAALAEELLFRGYPLQRLAVAFGKARAAVGLAIVFGLAHALNPDSSTLGMLNVGLAALVLSAAFFSVGQLPAAWGVHFGWNAGLGIAADAPVSGVQLGLPGLEYTTGQPAWFTGGGFGPEGGVVTSIVMIAAMVLLVRNNSRFTEDRTK